MPVLDISKLAKKQLAALSSQYDRISKMTVQPFPMMDVDPVRVEIDKAITNCLKLPDISILREMLAREPIISLKQL